LAGLWVLYWGMPCAQRYRLPRRWRVGILAIGRGVIFWHLFFFFFGHADLGMVWIPIWFATLFTFVTGI